MGASNSVNLTTPGRRFVAGAGLTGAAEYAVKPSYAYNSDGSMRPIAYINPTAPNATYIPAFAIPILIGALYGTLI